MNYQDLVGLEFKEEDLEQGAKLFLRRATPLNSYRGIFS